MPHSAQNPSFCGVCNLWLTGLWAHENRSKAHRDRLALIKANNFHREKVSAPTIKLTDDDEHQSGSLGTPRRSKPIWVASYELRILPDNFRSGRPKWECLFFTADRKLVSRRLAMELESKRTGKKYHVCARTEPTPQRTILSRQQTDLPGPSGCGGSPRSDTDALDVLNEIYADA